MVIVRSQSREFLGKCTGIQIDEQTVIGVSQFGITVLGAYKSRERAIEVLNGLHRIISESTSQDYLDGKYRIKQETIYVMPQK
ncbi:hypothetical protein CHF27_011065 [Romboutsia maritimum]|uniref:Uncharacterized protein n=1 Tax=Romboutsia maritimum TaxID=2020948 RepID=A0A371IQW2_9FIRM|nr:hypothetical protein [Romboutsia maritimum]RDY22853.1 hypothetical protein CHF27_011065 [Romboutsia maritimum]